MLMPIIGAISYIGWEKRIANHLKITHGFMKDLMIMRAIKPFCNEDEAKVSYDEWMVKHPTGYNR